MPQQKPLPLQNLKILRIAVGLAAQEFPKISRLLRDSLNLECLALDMVLPHDNWVSIAELCSLSYKSTLLLLTKKKLLMTELLGVEYVVMPLSAKLPQEYICKRICWQKLSGTPASLFTGEC